MHQDLLDSWLNMDTVFADIKSTTTGDSFPITAAAFLKNFDVRYTDNTSLILGTKALLKPVKSTLPLSCAVEAANNSVCDIFELPNDLPLVDFDFPTEDVSNVLRSDTKLSNFSQDLSNINLSDFSFEPDVINTFSDSTLLSYLSVNSVCLSNFWLSEDNADNKDPSFISQSTLIPEKCINIDNQPSSLCSFYEFSKEGPKDACEETAIDSDGSFVCDLISSNDADSFMTDCTIETCTVEDNKIDLDEYCYDSNVQSSEPYFHGGNNFCCDKVIAVEEDSLMNFNDGLIDVSQSWTVDKSFRLKVKKMPRHLSGKLQFVSSKNKTCKRKGSNISHEERLLRKRECDREAAYRYRQRKKKKDNDFESEIISLEKKNQKLSKYHSDLMMEATCLIETLKAVLRKEK